MACAARTASAGARRSRARSADSLAIASNWRKRAREPSSSSPCGRGQGALGPLLARRAASSRQERQQAALRPALEAIASAARSDVLALQPSRAAPGSRARTAALRPPPRRDPRSPRSPRSVACCRQRLGQGGLADARLTLDQHQAAYRRCSSSSAARQLSSRARQQGLAMQLAAAAEQRRAGPAGARRAPAARRSSLREKRQRFARSRTLGSHRRTKRKPRPRTVRITRCDSPSSRSALRASITT